MAAETDFEPYRPRLRAELARTRASFAALDADSRSVSAARDNSNVDDEHDPEGTTIAAELSQMSALARDARGRAEEIEAALARLDAGTYGVCASCGQMIAGGRLEARPWTPYCLDHATGK
ncbi:TraR/DksA C4-type zinc finger protein [Arthrobacter sp. Bz4]|uniref:TraR/DksA family transcriptional regulator n=1 Tax=Arthrobacter sp. Bz4 TaxID=2171979 RepID=UPI000D50C52E|nr:TraR/DksA C4-type zinc finger protein [Arthrobacter sp. Bz4]PVE15660.1 molecular chaperone DnaK [Arthrobacter sp. Bz4]